MCLTKHLTIVGISRGSQFSPNHVDNDAAIFNEVVSHLREEGHTVNVMTEKAFVEEGIEADYIFNMARARQTVERLKLLEEKGAKVINSGKGIDNCVRQTMTELLIGNGINHPRSYIVRTDKPFEPSNYPYWIKRGNAQAMVKADVVFVECREDAERVMADFRERNIPHAVVSEHLVGDLIKFYGVAGTDFFYTFYPNEQSHSKFGLEAINGAAKGYPFDKQALKRLSDKAASVLNVPIYGGDCVVDAQGVIRLIDFNDWPSFAPCRKEAGRAIATCIINSFLNPTNRE